ncbi:hypothetical protein DICPUDRAFT_81580 [Dictyostelium purpureum]|uniref:Uncharacterized protein n=1 Tax=Dictyostelium purpureum TaxID=5786 RepID=F0ZTX7_DICPU|nr:uncharacterized protein DICPUDRAFT_81580 [Dictyostelium purpureum]EGC32594.1 hypothetical protein DICPUDRAFT_81580 [Dictyostelium purpureum]|eukprot:XP_003290885.1 hypothetical protein DICPUDRAFT_81580 [Dictyostelium purpureum]
MSQNSSESNLTEKEIDEEISQFIEDNIELTYKGITAIISNDPILKKKVKAYCAHRGAMLPWSTLDEVSTRAIEIYLSDKKTSEPNIPIRRTRANKNLIFIDSDSDKDDSIGIDSDENQYKRKNITFYKKKNVVENLETKIKFEEVCLENIEQVTLFYNQNVYTNPNFIYSLYQAICKHPFYSHLRLAPQSISTC